MFCFGRCWFTTTECEGQANKSRTRFQEIKVSYLNSLLVFESNPWHDLMNVCFLRVILPYIWCMNPRKNPTVVSEPGSMPWIVVVLQNLSRILFWNLHDFNLNFGWLFEQLVITLIWYTYWMNFYSNLRLKYVDLVCEKIFKDENLSADFL